MLIFLLAWALVASLDLWLGGIVPRLDEPLGLRWLRAVAAHPVRSPLALTLVIAALRSPRRS